MIAEFLIFAWKCVYFFMPGIFANMAPVLVKRIDFLDYPVDFNRKWRGQPVFGSHKTFRGFFFGIICAVAIVCLQRWLFGGYAYFAGISIVDYSKMNPLLLGFLFGFGALFGDLVKSFFKRRMGIAPGKTWFPWDQIDLVIGGLLFVSMVFIPPLSVIIFAFLGGPVIHILVNHLGYYLKFKNSKW